MQEIVGSLPDRLRLLGLAGEERARRLLSSLTAAASGDGTNAIPIFGAKDSTAADDILWSRAVLKAFEENAEQDVRVANQLRNGLAELEMLFPGEGKQLLAEADLLTISDALRSERFYEQLPNMRSLLRATRERIHAQYAQVRSEVEESLQTIAAALEAHPDWALLADDDRTAIMEKLQSTLPLQPTSKDGVSELKTLLVRRNGLPGLQRTLEAEIARRLPPPPAPADGDESEVQVERVSWRTLQPVSVITSEAELDEWLKSLRACLAAYLRARKHIQID